MHSNCVWTFKVCRGGICQSIIPALPGETEKNHEEPRLGLPTYRETGKNHEEPRLGLPTWRETGKNYEEPRLGLPT